MEMIETFDFVFSISISVTLEGNILEGHVIFRLFGKHKRFEFSVDFIFHFFFHRIERKFKKKTKKIAVAL